VLSVSELLMEAGVNTWLRLIFKKRRRDRRVYYRVWMTGSIYGRSIELSLPVSRIAFELFFMRHSWVLDKASREKVNGSLVMDWKAGSSPAHIIALLFLAGQYGLRSRTRLEKLARCTATLSTLEPTLPYIAQLITYTLPDQTDPPRLRRRALYWTARIIQTYCGVA